jgi:hypothetical protein
VSWVDVRTQAELDAALLADDGNCVHCVGDGRFVIGGSSRVVARGSSRARVTSANAAWATAAEERDRIERELRVLVVEEGAGG